MSVQSTSASTSTPVPATHNIAYQCWQAMKSRCLRENDVSYENYGDSGITIDPSWINDFPKFLRDVGERPDINHTLERVNNKGNYEPGNVIWSDWTTQACNRSNNLQITYRGETKCMSEWCRDLGLDYDRVAMRVGRHRIPAPEVFDWLLGGVEPRPSTDYVLSRKIGAKQYVPGQVEWVLRGKENKRPNRVMVTHDGRTMSLTAWCKELGVVYRTAIDRVWRQGQSPHRALGLPEPTDTTVTVDPLPASVSPTKTRGDRSKWLTLHPLRATWKNMKRRCLNPNAPDYHNYGGRGIKICESWFKFENFIKDVGDRPPGLTLERRDVNGHYTPENVVWASRREQTRNRRVVKLIDYRGRQQRMIDWCEELGLDMHRIAVQVNRGGVVTEIFDALLNSVGPRPDNDHVLARKPGARYYGPGDVEWTRRDQVCRKWKNMVTHDGETMCVKDWCRKLGVEYGCIQSRIHKGMTPHAALGLPEPDQPPPHN